MRPIPKGTAWPYSMLTVCQPFDQLISSIFIYVCMYYVLTLIYFYGDFLPQVWLSFQVNKLTQIPEKS